jgi:hypothetical protein
MDTWLSWLPKQRPSKNWLEIVTIGGGGIFTGLKDPLVRELLLLTENQPIFTRLTLYDGDTFEPRNIARQDFDQIGNKAQVLIKMLEDKYKAKNNKSLYFRGFGKFIGETSIDGVADVKSVVLPGQLTIVIPDNDKTRKLIHDQHSRLRNSIVIYGGNDLTEGMAHLHIRKDNQDVTPSINWENPNFNQSKEPYPWEKTTPTPDCLQQQLFLANNDVAQGILILFNLLKEGDTNSPPPFFRIYSDARTASRRPVWNSDLQDNNSKRRS